MKPLRTSDFEPAVVMPAIRVADLSKSYKLYREPRDLLWEALTGRSRHTEKVVLQDISFEIPKGEVVGIVGANGAGKSTLLKILAGTLQPTSGSARVEGRVAAILELGTGFNPNYTGRENVILSGMLRGMSEDEIRKKFDAIVAFSGLASVIDQAFNTYSSGMQARLAFATAISVDAEVIIIDEALAAGDVRFASKSLRRIREISQSGITCLFVSHVTYQIMQLCTRAIWIDSGRVRMDGPAIEVVRAYEYEMHRLIAEDQGEAPPALQELVSSPPAVAEPQMDPSSATDTEVTGEGADLAPDQAPAPEGEEFAGASGLSSLSGEDAAAGASKAVAHSPNGAEPEPDVVPLNGSGTIRPPTAEVAAAPASGEALAGEPHEEGAVEAAVPAEEPVTAAAPAPAVAGAPDTPKRSHFNTGAYRIRRIRFLNAAGRETMTFRFGETFRLEVAYERLLPDPADISCGLAVAFNRTSDFEAVMYFNTNYPHSDQEMLDYESQPFRHFKGREGVVEARIEPLQLKSGEYYVSLGILPNTATHHEFYEYMHCNFRVTVLPNGFDEPSVFYPIVTWSNGPDAP